MRVTRLHLFLILIVLFPVGLFVAQIKQRRAERPAPTPVRPTERPAPRPAPPAEIPRAPAPAVISEPMDPSLPKPKTYQDSRQTIAVAGEYWKIARKKGLDVSRGQAILRRAKEEHRKGLYQLAINLARQSIEEFKLAKKLDGVKYTVKRGDSLWNISKMKKHYGRGALWVKIWRANEEKIPDFDLIIAGQTLFIPDIR